MGWNGRTTARLTTALSAVVVAAVLAAADRVDGKDEPMNADAQDPPAATAAGTTQLLFIHHSCGGQLLAVPGEPVGGGADSGRRCIYDSHPNGGDLRRRLNEAGYRVNEASYGSLVGEDTDIHHWPAKFRDRMDDVLRVARQDETLPDGRTNEIVAFKSCYPNNAFRSLGDEPGDASATDRTVANAKAVYRALLPHFRGRPDVLFVAFSAPPMAEPKPRGFKAKLKALFQGKSKAGEYARVFNTWLSDGEGGWLADYDLPNVVVFDYYDILTDGGRSDWSRYPTRDGRDSHPSSRGNSRAAEAFLPFLEEARARLAAAGGAS